MSLCASKTGASCSATTPHVSALLDRLLHHAHVLKCGPKSYRTRAGREESAHPRNRADHRAGGALQAPRPRSAVTALALAPCVRRWSLVSQRFAAGAAAPVKPGGRSWPRTAGERAKGMERVLLRSPIRALLFRLAEPLHNGRLRPSTGRF
jgi:hypothetical protein